MVNRRPVGAGDCSGRICSDEITLDCSIAGSHGRHDARNIVCRDHIALPRVKPANAPARAEYLNPPASIGVAAAIGKQAEIVALDHSIAAATHRDDSIVETRYAQPPDGLIGSAHTEPINPPIAAHIHPQIMTAPGP